MSDPLTEIIEAARGYYAQTKHFEHTNTDFYAWLDKLPVARRAEVLARGPTASHVEPGFLRYCLEWRGNGMRKFMAQCLSAAAFKLWEAHGEFNGDLSPYVIAW